MLKAIDDTLRQLTDNTQFCIAYSGGIDSQVLLHLMVQLRARHPQYTIRAVHINHGLSESAMVWQKQCQLVCAQWQVPFSSYSVVIEQISGESIEALARAKRYACFVEHLAAEECLLTAHNADDQAETVLLQLLRGAGVQGLAAMPSKKVLGHSILLRPLLTVSRAAIADYAVANQLVWIEDDSNQDTRFDRNYLRKRVLPQIKRRWPGGLNTIARSAEHCATAMHFIADMAAHDLQQIMIQSACIDVDRLLALSTLRQYQVMRYWIQQYGFSLPSTQQLQEIFTNVILSRHDAVPCFIWGAQCLRRYRRELYLMRRVSPIRAQIALDWNLSQALLLPDELGILQVNKILGGGLQLNKITQHCQVRFRQGGERIQPVGRQQHQTLKKLLQAWGVPPWQRSRIPLLYLADQLIMVVGYCIAEGYQANANETGYLVEIIDN